MSTVRHDLLSLRRAVLFALCALAVAGARSEDAPQAPLPPPPELVEGIQYEIGEPFLDLTGGTEMSDDMRRALEPPPAVAASPAPPPPASVYTVPSTGGGGYASAPAAYAPVVPGGIRISPPARYMPADYFDLPLDDGAIPGVLMPELDEQFVDPGMPAAAPAPAGRPASPGMTVRQLEPFFALAKGSEGSALDAKRRGDDYGYEDQIAKAVGAYMDIIAMADVSTEAREEAWYGVARCEYRRGNWWRAFDALERSFPRNFEKSEVAGRIKLEMFIGERLWRLGNGAVPDAVADGTGLNGYQAASLVYAAAIFNQPAAQDAPLALLRRGDAAAMAERWEEAGQFYRQVVTYYPESEQAMQAGSALTESIYRRDWPAGLPEAARDDAGSIMDDVERARRRLSPEAEERRRRVVELANDHEAGTRLRHAKDYLSRVRVRKSRDAAVFLLGDIVSRFPTTEQAREATEILVGLGVEPPLVLSDGSDFPLTAGWSGREPAAAGGTETGGGQVRLGGPGGSEGLEHDGGQDNAGDFVLPPSPTRETVYGTESGLIPDLVPME